MVNIEKSYDIIIVGGGPAGLASAKAAAEAGASVVVFEEHPGIGTPVQCGELFTRSALKEVGMKVNKRWFANEFHNVRLVAPGGTESFIRMPKDVKPPLLVIERKIWEKDLARRAAESGANIFSRSTVTDLLKKEGTIQGVKVRHMDKNMKVKGKIVLGCDGPGSIVGRKAGLRPYTKPSSYASIAQLQVAGIDVDSDIGEVHFHPTPADIFYIIPKGEGFANIGYGCLGTSKQVPLKRLRKFISRDPRLAKGSIIEINVGVEPISGLIKEIADDRVLLVGDAAGMVNPITAAGMRFCMWAGVRAGRIAGEAVATGDPSKKRLDGLKHAFNKTFGRRMKFMVAFRKVLFDLEPKDLDEIFSHVGTIDIPSNMFKGKKEPLFYPLRTIMGLVIKKPKFLRKFASLIPHLK